MDTAPHRPRIVPRTRDEAIRRVNLPTKPWQDLYHAALRSRWDVFLLGLGAVYVVINLVFAGLFLLQPGSISGAQPGSFADAFFFSVQCISTIGFGGLSPATLYANLIVTLEAFVSLLLVALVTGSVFARISRPQARVLFAQNAVIAPFEGVPTLFIRLANARSSQIVAAEAQLTMLRYQRTAEGDVYRRFYDLALMRSRTPVFALTYTVMHPIGPDSPLHGLDSQDLLADSTEILITVTGIEEVSSQTVHARHAYGPEEILWGRRYRDIFMTEPNGSRFIDFGLFHETDATA